MLHFIGFVIIGVVVGIGYALWHRPHNGSYLLPIAAALVGSLIFGFGWLHVFGALDHLGKYGSIVVAVVAALIFVAIAVERGRAASHKTASA